MTDATPSPQALRMARNAAKVDLRNLLLSLGFLQPPKHYLSALLAIGKWIEETEKEGKE